jgi:two-component system sensor histidine kinase KdpD
MTASQSGQLKIYMSYAPGVGKTYRMLEEAQTLKAQGNNTVIGALESHGRPDTIAKAEGMEVIPPKTIRNQDETFTEMDCVRILARRPQVCVVDDLPHTNASGSERAKRWEDVVVLLDSGISVLATMDIQNLESLNDEVRRLTGITIQETVPDWLVRQAQEVVMIDLTPRALLHRLERGVIYSDQQKVLERQDFFREPVLVALRELALREAAHAVEARMASGGPGAADAVEPGRKPRKQQKILVFLTADPKTAMVTRRARRVSDFVSAECIAVAVVPPGSAAHPEQEAIGKHLNFARNLHIDTRVLEGEDAAAALIDFARSNQVTQIFVSRPRPVEWSPLLSRDPVRKLITMAKDMEIVIVSDRDPEKR